MAPNPTAGERIAFEHGAALAADERQIASFHRRLTLYSAGGPFLDGYVLGIIGIALTQITPAWHLGSAWRGLLAAAALIGLFAGGLVFGYVTDLVGRQAMYTLDLGLILICSVAQFFVQGPVSLLIARLIMGIAIGADYPIASALLAEFAPKGKRGSMLGWLTAMWAAGNALACIAGDWMTHLGPDAWRTMLASPALIAGALMLARMGTPESPRWLLSKGRIEEARAALCTALGPRASLDDLDEAPARTSLRTVFSGVYLRRLIFVTVFWSCSIWPIYAIYAFGPALLFAFRLQRPGQANLGSAAIGLLFLAGCIAATLLANRWSRRAMLIGPFVVSTLALLGLGIAPNAPPPVIVALFIIYALAIGGPTIMQWIYPNELFPTQVRATAVGLATAFSRVGAALGTFVTPLLLEQAGVGATMLLAGLVSAAGVFISVIMAPETRGSRLGHAIR